MRASEFAKKRRRKVREQGLVYKGYPCTKDCSGHRAGYEWSQARGGQNANSPFSPSFNKGSAIGTQEIQKAKQQPKKPAPPQAPQAPNAPTL